MRRFNFGRALLALVLALTAASPVTALAQDYPSHAIRVIVPFPAGQGADILIRFLSGGLAEELRQPIVVENRPGAGGIIGTDAAAKSAADGYTLYVGSSGPLAISPFVYRDVHYDPVRDFAPISNIASVAQVLVTAPGSAIRSVQDLIKMAKAQPGSIQFASAGSGSTSHLTMELLAQTAGIALQHIPYKGSPPAQTDIIGGRVPLMFDAAPGVLSNVRAGTLKALAVSSRQRLSLLPDVPTVAESGVPGFETVGWIGLLAPAGTPPLIIARLNQAVIKTLAAPDTRARFQDLGFQPIGDSPQEFSAFIRSEVALWSRVVKKAGVTAE